MASRQARRRRKREQEHKEAQRPLNVLETNSVLSAMLRRKQTELADLGKEHRRLINMCHDEAQRANHWQGRAQILKDRATNLAGQVNQFADELEKLRKASPWLFGLLEWRARRKAPK